MKPYVGAVVQYLRRGEVFAAIITSVPHARAGWRDPVTLSVLSPHGGLLVQRMIERTEADPRDLAVAEPDRGFWRWAVQS